uniref:Reverse transcriptase domain-containing protein n=1 Tax=Fagus sylvatica TaxID=28930 RepID=A0A2N9G1C3_FAGSY
MEALPEWLGNLSSLQKLHLLWCNNLMYLPRMQAMHILAIAHEFHTHNQFEKSLNATFIALIPKKSEAREVKDFRPISLVGSVYKILAKVLANRLRLVLHKLISASQNAFMKGQQILDSVLIASECLDSRLKEGTLGVLCKLDLEKAYDHVNWGFLIYLLRRCGFSEKWRHWIMFCISTARFSILINGSSCDFFESSRGLRQGDPLSPLLFIIIMEALSKMMDKVVGGGLVLGFSVGMEAPRLIMVSHLLFADDTLIFCDADPNQVLQLQYLLTWFEANSGLKVNLGKSELVPVGDVPFIEELADMLGQVGYYLQSDSMWGVGCEEPDHVQWSFTWQMVMEHIRKGWNLLSQHVKYEVGDGTHIRFWKDLWCGESTLQEVFPDLYRIARDKDALISAHLQVHNDQIHWSLDFVRAAQDWEFESIASFLDLLYSTKVRGIGEDVMLWLHSLQNGFTVHSFCHVLVRIGGCSFPWKSIWQSKVPPRVSFFIWVAALGKILTAENLRKRHIILLSWCCLCKVDGETVDHLLLHCPFSREVWDMIFALFGSPLGDAGKDS